MYIYCIKNLVNSKLYVGKTTWADNNRFNCHKNTLRKNTHYNTHLQRAWNKYGECNFTFEVIEKCLHEDELNFLETYYIKHYASNDLKYGYNKSLGGEGNPMSQSTKDKLSKSKKEYFTKNEHWFKNKKHSDESLKRMSEGLKNFYKENGHPIKGRTCSPDHIKKNSEAQKKYNLENPNPFEGKLHSEKTKTLMSKNHRLKGISDIIHPYSKKVLAISPENIEMCFFSVTGAANFIKCSSGYCSNVCNGKKTSVKGWRLEYVWRN